MFVGMSIKMQIWWGWISIGNIYTNPFCWFPEKWNLWYWIQAGDVIGLGIEGGKGILRSITFYWYDVNDMLDITTKDKVPILIYANILDS